MNPIQKLLWVLVLAAGVATAVAGVQAWRKYTPSDFSLGTLGDSVPEHLRGKVWFAQVLESDCQRCKELRESATLTDPDIIGVPVERSESAPGEGIKGDAADELAARLYALNGDPETPEDLLLLRNFGDIGEWSLTAEDGKPMGNKELAGKVYIADFMFTNCAGPCPMMNEAMKTLVGKLPADPRLRFISFSVDPRNDTPEVLAAFAKTLEAPPQWRFLTGIAVYNLAYERFKLMARPDPDAGPGNAVLHSTSFSLVDAEGRLRGQFAYDYDEPEKIPPVMERLVRSAKMLLETPEKVIDHLHDERLFLVDRRGMLRGVYPSSEKERLLADARRLVRSPDTLMSWRSLPALNASLNGVCFLFLSTGMALVLNRRLTAHKVFMTLALITSVLFLASYLTYHFQVGSVKYTGEGWMRTGYFAILLSHTVLAAAVAPMALVTVVRAWKGNLDRHVAIARWTLPVWMYVSLTGILVYLMLYRM